MLRNSLIFALLVTGLQSVCAAPFVSGRVFEDGLGNGINGSTFTTISGEQRTLPGAVVRLWRDVNGNGVLDSGDAQVGMVATDSNGRYSLDAAGVVAGQAAFVSVGAPTRDGSSAGNPGVLGEQSYASGNSLAFGSAGSIRPFCSAGIDAAVSPISASAVNQFSGSCYSGRYPGADDVQASPDGAKHVSYVGVGSGDVSGVDFGFSFNLVTNSRLSGQGSLAQFILNDAKITAGSAISSGLNTMRFVPVTCRNNLDSVCSGANTHWVITRDASGVGSLPPVVHQNTQRTTLDGTAYSYADGVTVLAGNPKIFGADGSVGVPPVPFSKFTAPSLEIRDLSLDIGPSGSTGWVTVANLALNARAASIRFLGSVENVSFRNSTIGVAADDSGVNLGGGIVYASSRMGTFVMQSLYIKSNGVAIDLSGTTTVKTRFRIISSEIRTEQVTAGPPLASAIKIGAGGLTGASMSTGSSSLVSGNLFSGVSGVAFDDSGILGASSMVNIISNTFSGGMGGAIVINSQNSTANSYVVARNFFDRNSGAAVSIGANTMRINVTSNSFLGNSGAAIDLGGDGVTTASSCTGAGSANGGLGRPVLSRVFYDGANLRFNADYCGNGDTYVLELYKVSVASTVGDIGSDGVLAGEGFTYLGKVGNLTGGSLVGGSIAVSSGALSPGDMVGAILWRSSATVGGDTSEFSPSVTVAGAVRLSLRASLDGTPVRMDAADQVLVQVMEGAAVAGAAQTSAAGTSTDTPVLVLPADGSNYSYVLKESLLAGSVSPMGYYQHLFSCTTSVGGSVGNAGSGLSSPAPIPITPIQIPLTADVAQFAILPAAGDTIVCTSVVRANPPRLRVSQVSIGEVGAFSYAGNSNANGYGGDAITTVTAGAQVDGVSRILALPGVLTEVVVSTPSPAANWTVASLSCQDANAAATGNPASIGSLSGSVISLPIAQVLPGADIRCVVTATFTQSAYVISGRLILDTGAGGGSAYDAVANGAEPGVAGVGVSLALCSSPATYSKTVVSDGAGAFSFDMAGAPAGRYCLTRQADLSNSSVSFGWGDIPVAGRVGLSVGRDLATFDWAGGVSQSGVVFGSVPKATLAADGQSQAAAGQWVSYGHVYKAGGPSNLVVSSGNSSPGWMSIVYLDVDCSGELSGVDSVITAPVSVLAGQSLCLLTRVMPPAGAHQGAQNQTTTTVVTMLSPDPVNGAWSVSLDRIDSTVVVPIGVSVVKQVRKLSACPASAAASQADVTPFSSVNQARPGDYLEYRISYRNDTPVPASGLSVSDWTPDWTRFRSAFCLTTPSQGLLGCSVVSQPVAGGTGGVKWLMPDAAGVAPGLQPSAGGSVSYCVQVEP